MGRVGKGNWIPVALRTAWTINEILSQNQRYESGNWRTSLCFKAAVLLFPEWEVVKSWQQLWRTEQSGEHGRHRQGLSVCPHTGRALSVSTDGSPPGAAAAKSSQFSASAWCEVASGFLWGKLEHRRRRY